MSEERTAAARWAACEFTDDEISAAVAHQRGIWSDSDITGEAARLLIEYWTDNPDSFFDYLSGDTDPGDPAAAGAASAALRGMLVRQGMTPAAASAERCAALEFEPEEFSAAAACETADTAFSDLVRDVERDRFDYWQGAPDLFCEWLADEDDSGASDRGEAAARTMRRILAERTASAD